LDQTAIALLQRHLGPVLAQSPSLRLIR